MSPPTALTEEAGSLRPDRVAAWQPGADRRGADPRSHAGTITKDGLDPGPGRRGPHGPGGVHNDAAGGQGRPAGNPEGRSIHTTARLLTFKDT